LLILVWAVIFLEQALGMPTVPATDVDRLMGNGPSPTENRNRQESDMVDDRDGAEDAEEYRRKKVQQQIDQFNNEGFPPMMGGPSDADQEGPVYMQPPHLPYFPPPTKNRDNNWRNENEALTQQYFRQQYIKEFGKAPEDDVPNTDLGKDYEYTAYGDEDKA